MSTKAAIELYHSNIEKFLETMKYSKEIQGVLESMDLSKTEKVVNNIKAIHEKALRSQSNLRQMEENLENEKTELAKEISGHYRDIVSSDTGATPTDEEAEKVLRDFKEQIREDKEELKMLLMKQKDLNCLEMESKLQKKALPIHFDQSSTDQVMCGFVKRCDGRIESFSFDITKHNPVEIANCLWEMEN